MFLEDLAFHMYSDLVTQSLFDLALKLQNCCSFGSFLESVLLLRAKFGAPQSMLSSWILLTCVSLSIAQSSAFLIRTHCFSCRSLLNHSHMSLVFIAFASFSDYIQSLKCHSVVLRF